LSIPAPLRPFLLPVLLIAVWQWATTGLAATNRAPSPARVAAKAVEMIVSGEIPLAILESLQRVALGFAAAASLALLIGAAMGAFRSVGRNLDPLIESFRPIAPIALLPLAILWFGNGTPAAAFIVGYAAFFPMLINTIHGVRSVDTRLIQASRTLGVGQLTTLRTVLLPGALPSIFIGARLALGVAWTSIIAAELAVGAKAGGGSTGGIGQMMFVFYAYSVELNGIVVCMITVGIVALVIDRGLRAFQRWAMPWVI
jgi:ABC-type nitrate/sulfonate/bicarbonate transport system permease component